MQLFRELAVLPFPKPPYFKKKESLHGNPVTFYTGSNQDMYFSRALQKSPEQSPKLTRQRTAFLPHLQHIKTPEIIRGLILSTLFMAQISSLIQTLLSVLESPLYMRVTSSAAEAGRGLYRRLGIAPDPEEFILFTKIL